MMKRTAPRPSDEPVQYVRNSVTDLRKRYLEWDKLAGQARQKLWATLGQIHADSAFVREHAEARAELVRAANEDPEVGRSRFDATSAPAQEIFLALILKIREATKSAKSQYTRALLVAESEGVPPTEEAFVTWVKDNGGITAAGKSDSAEGPAASLTLSPPVSGRATSMTAPYHFKLARFLEWAPKLANGSVEIEIDREKEAYEGLTVVLLSSSAADPDANPAILAKIGDPQVVKSVASAVASGRAVRLTDEDKANEAARKALWELNRVALKLSYWNEKLSFDDLLKFPKAVKVLEKQDCVARRLFEGPAGSNLYTDAREFHSLDVIHPEYDLIDPGRYIRNAREGALIPYEAGQPGSAERAAAIAAYVQASRVPWVYETSAVNDPADQPDQSAADGTVQ